MKKFGIENTSTQSIRDLIEEYKFIVKSNIEAEAAAAKTSTETGETKDFSSALDDLVESVAPSSVDMSPVADEDTALTKEEFEVVLKQALDKSLPASSLRNDKAVWDELLQKYLPSPRNELEKERSDLFNNLDPLAVKDLHTESDLKQFNKRKLESEVIYRAKLLQLFNAKESQRIQADWSKRGFQRTLSLASPDMVNSSNQ